jgi:hypothetical protein
MTKFLEKYNIPKEDEMDHLNPVSMRQTESTLPVPPFLPEAGRT